MKWPFVTRHTYERDLDYSRRTVNTLKQEGHRKALIIANLEGHNQRLQANLMKYLEPGEVPAQDKAVVHDIRNETKQSHLARIQAGDNWKAFQEKYRQVKAHFVRFKLETAQAVNFIRQLATTNNDKDMENLIDALLCKANELEDLGAYDPGFTDEEVAAIYGGLENVPAIFLSDQQLSKLKEKALADKNSG